MKAMRNVLIGFIVGLAIGFIPMYLNYSAAEGERVRLSEELAISEAHSRMALLMVRVVEGEWGPAGPASTAAFDAVDHALETVEDPEAQRRLTTAANARDDVTAAIAVGDDTVTEDVRRLVMMLGASL